MASVLDIYDGVHAQLETLAPGVTKHFGPEALYLQEAPPRIVWVPTGDNYGPPSQRGSDRAGPVARHTCRTGIAAHVWGAGWAETILLKDQFIQALRLFLGPNYHPSDGRWVGSADNQSAGKLYVLSFSLDIPVVDPVTRLVTVTATTQSDVAFVTPGV